MTFRASAVVAILCAAPFAAHAAPISTIVVYGDSLSDNGNLYKLDHGSNPLSPPYYNGRFSNGPVAVEQLASSTGATLVDFAYGGATSGVGNYGDGGSQTTPGAFGLPGMQVELAASQATIAPLLNPNTLFIVWGGANDLLSMGSPAVAASNIDNIVSTLELEGATHILVPGLPDLGATPLFNGTSLQATATGYTGAFNTLVQSGLPKGATYFDTFSLLSAIQANGAAYGFTDTTTPCLNATAGTVCSDPNSHLFWDDLHPTTAADAILAREFASAAGVTAATPEPSSLLLTLTGLGSAVTLLRRRYQRA